MCKQKYFSVFWVIVIFSFFIGHSAKPQQPDISILFYNVENLFDTIDDPLTNDSQFLPEGRYKWGQERYKHKLRMLGQAIAEDGTVQLPALIGLVEVENRLVLSDLIATEFLKKGRYEIAHYDSPDERGIDVALLYNPNVFRVLKSAPLEVKLPWNPSFRTRDILYVQGIIDTDTLHVYVNHWPSRRGGSEASEPNRIRAAEVLRNHIDSVAPHYRNYFVVVMGDMNDEPNDRSVKEVLNSAVPGLPCAGTSDICLWNLSATISEGDGTYYYWREQRWNILDNILLNTGLFDTSAFLYYVPGSFTIVKTPMLLKEERGVLRPYASFAKDYEGGYSDHLPVKFLLRVNPRLIITGGLPDDVYKKNHKTRRLFRLKNK